MFVFCFVFKREGKDYSGDNKTIIYFLTKKKKEARHKKRPGSGGAPRP